MQTYEFSSIIDEQGIIHIPAQYLQNISSPVKVIILASDDVQSKKQKRFAAIKLKTNGFKFDREIANER